MGTCAVITFQPTSLACGFCHQAKEERSHKAQAVPAKYLTAALLQPEVRNGKNWQLWGEKARDNSSHTGREVAKVNVGALVLPGTGAVTPASPKSTSTCGRVTRSHVQDSSVRAERGDTAGRGGLPAFQCYLAGAPSRSPTGASPA